jgi:hypothetical protein
MIGKNMENKFAVHYQTWKQEKAAEFAITKFREFFPNEQLRLISDNGLDYSHFIPKYNIDFEFSNISTGSRLKNIDACYVWLERVFNTCILYDTEWIVIFEDDVLTQNNNITFPTEDSGGMICWPWENNLTQLLKSRNNKNQMFGYGMCGGSIFRRESFINAYSRIHEFDLKYIGSLDNRVTGYCDTLIGCFLQYFGYSYQIWESTDDMTYPDRIPSETACFIHGYKELY